MHRLSLPIILLLLLVAACGGKYAVHDEAPMPDAASCPFVYAFAPGNYIIDVASGAEVILDPAAQEFPLFCRPPEARAFITEEVTAGRLAEGDWRVYRLDGQFEELAQKSDDGRYTLKRMASVVDWVTEAL